MTTPNDILRDGFERVHESVPEVVEGLSVEQLLWRPDPDANSVGWLVWHLTRVQDDHIAGIAAAVGQPAGQLYTEDWADRFRLPYDVREIGYGHSSEEVASFTLDDPALLAGYHEATHQRTLQLLDGFDKWDRIVDESWDPPVTAAVRLVSVVNDITQHVGQAAYVRGLIERR